MVAAVGDVVHYHGTFRSNHGMYRVIAVPPNPFMRGYRLSHMGDGDIIENVHPNSFTASPIKRRTAMSKKDSVSMKDLSDYKIPKDEDVEEEEFDPEGWDNTVPILMWAIRKGLVDKHLRAVGEVMRERFILLYPEAKPTSVRQAQSSPDWYTTEEAEMLDLLGRDKCITPVSNRTGAGIVEFQSVYYNKQTMVGQYFRMPDGLLGNKGLSKYVGKKVVQIVSVGTSRLTVRLAEDPSWATRQDFRDALKTKQWAVSFDDIAFIFKVEDDGS